MKTRHKTTIHARCPAEGNPPDTYEAEFVTGELIPVETIQAAIDELTRVPIFQEVLTTQLATVLKCTVITIGKHGAGAFETWWQGEIQGAATVRVLVSGCTETVAEWEQKRPDRVGRLLTPGNGNVVPESVWAADNECFRGLDPVKWLRMLAKIVESGRRPLWVACPDKVADAEETQRLFNRWAPILEELGLPIALVLQDGVERFKWRGTLTVNLHRLAAVFVGGTTEWKLSQAAFDLCCLAKENGLLVHVGRVNSLERIHHFAGVADSFDGRQFSAWGQRWIPKAVQWIDKALGLRQPLFDRNYA